MNVLEELPDHVLDFLTERHLGCLTTLRRDGSPHTVPVGFTVDRQTGLARVITSGGTVKARNVRRDRRVTLTQVDGRRWISLEGLARVAAGAVEVADAEARYAARYRQPRANPQRVALVVELTRVLGGRWPFP